MHELQELCINERRNESREQEVGRYITNNFTCSLSYAKSVGDGQRLNMFVGYYGDSLLAFLKRFYGHGLILIHTMHPFGDSFETIHRNYLSGSARKDKKRRRRAVTTGFARHPWRCGSPRRPARARTVPRAESRARDGCLGDQGSLAWP